MSADWSPPVPVRILAGTPPGGGQDRAARALGAALEQTLEVEVVVENVPGRGGSNAWDELARRSGAGGRLSISSPTVITNVLTGVAGRHDRLAQIAMLCTEFIVFAVPSSSRITTAVDLLEALGAAHRPVVSLATARGNVNHLAVARLARHAGVDARSISIRVFDSAPAAIADSLARDGVAAVSAASVVPELGTGRLKALAVSAPERLAADLAGVPTWSELDVDCVIGTWRGVMGPPVLSHELRSFWIAAIAEAVQTDVWRWALLRHHWTDTHLDGEALTRFLLEEELRFRNGLGDLGLLPG